MPYSSFRDRSLNDVYFRAVANFTYDWESWHDPDGKLVWVNDAVNRMTGFSPTECLQMEDYPLPIVFEDDRTKVEEMLRSAVAGESRNDVEFRIRTAAGEVRWMAVSWQPMHADDGQHLGIRTSVRNITERQSLREQLRLYAEHLEQLVEERTARIATLEKHRQQMEKLAALGELAAGVAHEVNNPLAGIRNAFALFRSSIDPEHEHFDLLDMVDREIERISSIIHQMYQLYRRNPQQPVDFSLSNTIRDVLCLLEPVAGRRKVELNVSPPEVTEILRLPEGEVKQVLINLVRNAIQASPVNSVVTIAVTSDSKSTEIKVIDHGSGIDEKVLPHIFEPFFTTKGELKEGMGLGLAVSKTLVETMGGTLEVETEIGKGSTFRVVLPAFTAGELS